MSADVETVTLWRPVGPKELDLNRASEMRSFPPRLPEQPIFYPSERRRLTGGKRPGNGPIRSGKRTALDMFRRVAYAFT